jgi:hypothetical protein
MSKVRVPRTRVTQDEVITVLGRRLGAGYRLDRDNGRSVRVSKNGSAAAVVHISDTPGATVFRVHGRGLPLIRLANSLTTGRRVANALRHSAEFRSL